MNRPTAGERWMESQKKTWNLILENKEFRALMNLYESNPTDGDILDAFAQAIANSVLSKCADPMRKTAVYRDKVSDNGMNKAIMDMQSSMNRDSSELATLRRSAADYIMHTVDENGNSKQVIKDGDAAQRVDTLIGKTLSDGMDVKQRAALKLWGCYLQYGVDSAENWLEKHIILRKLSKHVLINREDSAAFKDCETTPIQEIFKDLNALINKSAAVENTSRYCYIEDYARDDESGVEDMVYRRLKLYSDLGGAVYNGTHCVAGSPCGYDVGNGLYTADENTVDSYYRLRDMLHLTDRQEQILSLRERGYGYKAIATYLGISQGTVVTTMRRIAQRAEDSGMFGAMLK